MVSIQYSILSLQKAQRLSSTLLVSPLSSTSPNKRTRAIVVAVVVVVVVFVVFVVIGPTITIASLVSAAVNINVSININVEAEVDISFPPIHSLLMSSHMKQENDFIKHLRPIPSLTILSSFHYNLCIMLLAIPSLLLREDEEIEEEEEECNTWETRTKVFIIASS